MGYHSIPCGCGGRSNLLPYWRDKHKLTPQHQEWAIMNPDKYIMPKKIYKYTCVCGTKMTQKNSRNIAVHERTPKHIRLINEQLLRKNEIASCNETNSSQKDENDNDTKHVQAL